MKKTAMLALVALSLVFGFSAVSQAETVIVKMQEQKFSPEVVKLNAGDSILWINSDHMTHHVGVSQFVINGAIQTISATEAKLDSGKMMRWEEFSYRFDKPGTYYISCRTMGGYGMTMKVAVQKNENITVRQ